MSSASVEAVADSGVSLKPNDARKLDFVDDRSATWKF